MSATCPRSRAAVGGFTLVELVVASLVMVVALIGVYALFGQVMAAEGGATARAGQRAAARAVVDHLADALEQVVVLADVQPIRGEPDADAGGYVLTCVVGAGTPSGVVQRRRYAWQPPGAAVGTIGADSVAHGTVTLTVLSQAGTVPIAPIEGAAADSAVDRWSLAPTRVIGTGVEDLSVTFRAGDDARWQRRWSGRPGAVLVRVSARVGGQTVERVVAPPVDDPLVIETEPEQG